MKHPLFGLKVMHTHTEEEYTFVEFISSNQEDEWVLAILLDYQGKVVYHEANDLEFNIEKVELL